MLQLNGFIFKAMLSPIGQSFNPDPRMNCKTAKDFVIFHCIFFIYFIFTLIFGKLFHEIVV